MGVQCLCRPGTGRENATSICIQCESGTYSPGNDTSACTLCPANTTSPAGSTSSAHCYCPRENEVVHPDSEACVCAPGFGRAGAGAGCTLCPEGTYNTGGGDDVCILCAAGYTAPAGSTAAGNCTCAGVNEQLDEGLNRCVCLPGYGRANSSLSQPCAPCANGTFSGANGSDACVACAPWSTAPPQSTDAADCSCLPGYGRAGANATCAQCAANTYGPSGGEEACVPCPGTQTSRPGSADASACSCSDEYRSSLNGICLCAAGNGIGDDGGCGKCLPDEFGPNRTTGKCNACPPNMTTLVHDARSIVDCVCLPGHGLTPDGYAHGCVPCAAGTALANEHTLFDYVGDGACEGTCAHAIERADESACALECAQRVICAAYSFQPLPAENVMCTLYRSTGVERGLEEGWSEVVHNATCSLSASSTGAHAGACRVKQHTASSFGMLTGEDTVQYIFIGYGWCNSGGRYAVSFKAGNMLAATCKRACTKDTDCIGYTFHPGSLHEAAYCLKHYAYYHFNNSDASFTFDSGLLDVTGLDVTSVEPDDENRTVCYRKQSRPPLACLPCAPGSAQKQTQQSSCASCMAVGYQDGGGQEECKLCSSSQQGFYTHSVQAGDCSCKPGFAGSANGGCRTCVAPNYTQKTVHDYTLLGNGTCAPAAGHRINGRTLHGINHLSCEAECESWSSCSGYEFITSDDLTTCTVFGQFLDAGLPEYSMTSLHATGQWYGIPYWNSGMSSTILARMNAQCYRRDPRPATDRTCHACPLGGRAPPGSGSAGACVLTRALPAGLNASAWRAQGAGLLYTSTAEGTLDVLRYRKHEVTMRNDFTATLRFNAVPPPYTCVNITAGIGPFEAQAPGQTVVFGNGTYFSASFVAGEPYARATATICGFGSAGKIAVSSDHTALDAHFELVFFIADAGAFTSITVTPHAAQAREPRPHVHAHGHNVSVWGVGGARGVTVLHDETHDLLHTFARNLTAASVGAVHRHAASSTGSGAAALGLWLWQPGAGVEYVKNVDRQTVQEHLLPLPADALVHMLAPDPTDTWVICVLATGTSVLVLDINSTQWRNVVRLESSQYVQAVFAHTGSYIYVAYMPVTPAGVTDGTSGNWVRYRLDMHEYMVQMQLPVAAAFPPALCEPGSWRDAYKGICLACACGTYKHWVGDEACLQCGVHETTARMGSKDNETCQCERGFGVSSEDNACVQCPDGKFKHTVDRQQCKTCGGSGEFAAAGVYTTCACAAGKYFNTSMSTPTCMDCPLHTFKDDNGTGQCTECGANMHTQAPASEHASACLCDAGHGLQTADATGHTHDVCLPCALGSYAPGDSRTPCNPCASGKYAEQSAQSACKLCPDGFYAPAPGGIQCELCVHPDAASANRSSCAPALDAAAHACANKTIATLEQYARLRREDLTLETLAELEHSPGGLRDPSTQTN